MSEPRFKAGMTDDKIKFVSKNWGFEKIIVNNEKYCGKLLYIVKNKATSTHYHKIKDEVIYVQSGEVNIYWTDDLEKFEKDEKFSNGTAIVKGNSFHIPTGRVHKIVAMEDTELFEFSTHHEDDDSIRLLIGD